MIGKRAHGIDISHYQEELIPPPDNNADIDFVILKASQAKRPDSAFEHLYLAAKEFPLRGAYHYFVTRSYRTSELLPDRVVSPKKVIEGKAQGVKAKNNKGVVFKGPEVMVFYRKEWVSVRKARVRTSVAEGPNWQEQADFFLSKVAGKDIHFFALDVERGSDPEKYIGFEYNIFGTEDIKNIKNWIGYVKDKTGKPVLLYTNSDVYLHELSQSGGQILADLDLWLAGYLNAPRRDEQDPVSLFKVPSKNWRFWQYSADKNGLGAAYGVKTESVDLDVFNGTREELYAWLGLQVDGVRVTVHPDEKRPPERMPERGEAEKRIATTFAQLELIKKVGLRPVVHIHLHMDEFNLETANSLKERLRQSGLEAEIVISVELTLEADGGSRSVPLEAGDERAVERKPDFGSGGKEKREPEAATEDSFSVEVTETKALVQYIHSLDKAGKPFMLPRDPRIRLPQGTRISVSATHKASDKDSGDGNVHGTGNKLYYFITACPFNREAEGFYLRQADVRRV